MKEKAPAMSSDLICGSKRNNKMHTCNHIKLILPSRNHLSLPQALSRHFRAPCQFYLPLINKNNEKNVPKPLISSISGLFWCLLFPELNEPPDTVCCPGFRKQDHQAWRKAQPLTSNCLEAGSHRGIEAEHANTRWEMWVFSGDAGRNQWTPVS